jgi:MSHA biogenesis protein MshM
MYLEHFGLAEFPFSLTPNTRFRVDLAGLSAARDALRIGLANGEGFIKVVGEVGTGKTLLCRLLLDDLDERFWTAWVPNPALPPTELLKVLIDELGTERPRGGRRFDLTSTIQRRLIEIRGQGRSVVVLVDEAQAMPDATLETLRLLTNLETDSIKLLQLVLFGQPELDARLARPELRQLRQRITLPHRLQGLQRSEVETYVEQRLRLAGAVHGDLFSRGALGLLHRASRGIPRLVNVLAHKSLMSAFGAGRGHVQRRDAQRAVEDTEDASRLRGARGLGRSIAQSLGWSG